MSEPLLRDMARDIVDYLNEEGDTDHTTLDLLDALATFGYTIIEADEAALEYVAVIIADAGETP